MNEGVGYFRGGVIRIHVEPGSDLKARSRPEVTAHSRSFFVQHIASADATSKTSMPETSKLHGSEPTGEEERPATPPLTDQVDVGECVTHVDRRRRVADWRRSLTDDKCTVVVPSTAELVPLTSDSASELHELVVDAVDGLRCSDDWTRQYEVSSISDRLTSSFLTS
jgi:hypothetical protein